MFEQQCSEFDWGLRSETDKMKWVEPSTEWRHKVGAYGAPNLLFRFQFVPHDIIFN